MCGFLSFERAVSGFLTVAGAFDLGFRVVGAVLSGFAVSAVLLRLGGGDGGLSGDAARLIG